MFVALLFRLSFLGDAVGDDRIVAEMLHAKVSNPAHLMVFSYDMRPLAAAKRHGLGWKKPADHRLLEPEPSPHQKEVQRLQQRVRELEISQPAIEFELAAPPDMPLRPVRVQPLDENISRILAELYLEKHAPQGRGRFDFLTDHSYDDRYEAFERRVRSHGANIAAVLELFFNQFALQLSIKAPGAMAAEHLEIAFEADGLLIHDRIVLGPLLLPQPPEYEPDGFVRRIGDTTIDLPVRYGRSDVYFDPELKRTSSARLVCEDFRHGWHFERRLYVTLDPRRASPEVLRYRVTAANRRGAVEGEITLHFETEDVRVNDLIDLDKNEFRRNAPLFDLTTKLLESGDTEEIDTSEFDT